MKTKKRILGLGLGMTLLGGFTAHAQSGLEGIIVEKYYRADANDAADGIDPVAAGTSTYRVYVDLADGYQLQAVYGDVNHKLSLKTTTTFWNNTDRDTYKGDIASNQMNSSTHALDSWITMGGAASGNLGVLKSEDNGAANLILGNTRLTNAAPSYGIPLTTQDGMQTGTVPAITIAGIDTDLQNTFLDGGSSPSSLETNNGAWSTTALDTGATASNRVLIGQFTTDGIFTFELNLQMKNISTGEIEKWVSGSPQAGEFTHASLIDTIGNPPTVGITSPTASQNFFVGNPVSIDATAADADGTVASVEFFLDGVSRGTDVSSPYSSSTFTITAGAHNVTAVATDNDGNVTTSATVAINGVVNQLPTVAVTAPSAGANYTGDLGGVVTSTVTITASASDSDGTVDSVAFFVGGVRVGSVANPGPYSFDWAIPVGVYGTQSITAKAYDNDGGIGTSAAVSIAVENPNAKPYFAGDVEATCVAAGFCLPIKAKDTIANVLGFDMVLYYDKTKVAPTGVITAGGELINASYVTVSKSIDAANGSIDISVALNNQAPANTFFTGVGELVCVGFNKTSGFGSVDTALFSMDSIIESRYTGVTKVAADAGKFITYKDSSFHASLKFWADNSAIKYDTANPATYLITDIYSNNANCSNLSATSVQPDLSGNFDFTVGAAQVGDLTFNIERDIDAATSVQPVVNGFDALLVQKVLVGDPSFVPSVYQMIAMDVNQDGVISSGDVTQLNQRSVLLIPEFKQAWNYNANGTPNGAGDSKDWVFIDETTATTDGAYLISSIFPLSDGVGYSKDRSPLAPTCLAVNVSDPAGCPLISSETYTGVLLGDVNGNYKNIVADGLLRSESKVVFDLTQATVVDGKVIIPVTIVSDQIVNALDFAVQMDAAISYDSFISYMATAEAMDNFNAADGTMRFTSFSFDNYTVGQPVVAVVYDADSIGTANFRETAAYVNGEEVQVEVIGDVVTPSAAAEGNLVEVYPNPAADVVNVVASEDATAQLVDVNGSVVLTFNLSANQVQTVATTNLTSGLYTLKVANENFVSVTKVVIVK